MSQGANANGKDHRGAFVLQVGSGSHNSLGGERGTTGRARRLGAESG